jgi:hypothetical protein
MHGLLAGVRLSDEFICVFEVMSVEGLLRRQWALLAIRFLLLVFEEVALEQEVLYCALGVLVW